jgi:hypothetical protein
MSVRLLFLAVVAALAAAVSAATIPSARATTEPIEEIDIHVTIRDSGITLDRKSAPRGAAGRFIVFNLGKKPHTFTLGSKNVVSISKGLTTGVIKPGAKVKVLLVYLDFRGALTYRSVVKADLKNPRFRGTFTIE